MQTYLISGLFLLLLAALGGAISATLRQRRRISQLADLTRHLLITHEEEKAKLARDLHGELGSTLTAVNMDLSWIKQKIADEAISARLARAAELLSKTVIAKRRIIQELRPAALDHLGLAAAMEVYAADFSQKTGIAIEVQAPEELSALPPACPIAFFRIFQEALSNAERHAQAKKVDVTIRQDNKRIALEIVDDGIGMDAALAHKSGCYGLATVREHAAQMGGDITIGVGPDGRGTALTVSMPCPGAAD